MARSRDTRDRVTSFCEGLQLRQPILLAPMAGACPPALSIAVANAGSLGACGAVLMAPDEIGRWAAEFRAGSQGSFQINLWIPDRPARRDAENEAAVRRFLTTWGPEVPPEAAENRPPDFTVQCEAVLAAAPSVASSIMGPYPPDFVGALKSRRIRWFATATTVAEAKLLEAAGADAVIAQGMEAGGHRGAFDPAKADRELVGLFALVPAMVDAVSIPVVAAGAIADSRGVAAALTLGASAVLVGTSFLRSPEAQLPAAWAAGLGRSLPEETILTRAFSGRLGRSLPTAYARAAAEPDAPTPAPYPVQRGLTQPMRTLGTQTDDLDRLQAWAGQAGGLARARPAAEIAMTLWEGARDLLGL